MNNTAAMELEFWCAWGRHKMNGPRADSLHGYDACNECAEDHDSTCCPRCAQVGLCPRHGRDLAACEEEAFKMKLEDLAREVIARELREEHPRGEFDGHGRWYPAVDERADCCKYIRTPSNAWPYSLLVHARTARHVACREGVDLKALRRAVRALYKKRAREALLSASEPIA